MRIDSYDTVGFKYGIIAFENRTMEKVDTLSKVQEDQEKLKTILSNEKIIEFDQVDGLTLEDLSSYSSMLCGDVIFFVMYDHVPTNAKKNVVRHVIKIEKSKHPAEIPIDEVIVNYIDQNYHDLGVSERKRANGFLQRYKYGTSEATREHVQYLINKH